MKQALSILTISMVLVASGAALGQDKNVKIGVLSDQSGLYADLAGPGSTVAAQMAVEDSGLLTQGWKIEVIAADHQNKPDIASAVARRWLEADKVDVIADVPGSGAALAVSKIVKERNGVFLASTSATTDLTTSQCSPNTVHWTYDTYLLANGTGREVVRSGGDTWFFVAADYAFGHAMERDAGAVVTANGGKILGSVRHPINTQDFSSFLLQAQASKAKVIGLATGGGDTINAIKQASEFGIVAGGQKLVALALVINDVHALGLKVAQGLTFTETFYWDANDQTRAFSRRFSERVKNKAMPSMMQAGVYAATLHYLKSVAALGANPHDGLKVVDKMKEMPTNDPLFGKGYIRADGRKIHPGYLFEVKKPSESKGDWDYYKLMATIPAEDAFTPSANSSCPLLMK